MTKETIRAGMIGVLLIGGALAAHADTLYTYSGNPFTGAFGNYLCPNCALTFSITLRTPLPVNFIAGVTPTYNRASQRNDLFPWSNNNGHIPLSNSTLSDGLQSIMPTSTNFGHLGNPNFYFYKTDAGGLPTEWGISVQLTNDAFYSQHRPGNFCVGCPVGVSSFDFSIHRPSVGWAHDNAACEAGFGLPGFSGCNTLQGSDRGVFNMESAGTWTAVVLPNQHNPVPEPKTLRLLIVGLAGLGLMRRHYRVK